MKPSFILFHILLYSFTLFAQQPDEVYKKPLQEVLKEVEQRFKVKLNYSESLVKDKMVAFAPWRFRDNVESTLNNILGPADMIFNKTGDNTYEVRKFDYHRRTPEEGKEHLDRLLSLYSGKEEWETRKAELQSCIQASIGLSPMPAATNSKPIVSSKRTMNGYTVENVAIETLPGVYATGSLYRPLKGKGPFPAILVAQGHGPNQHFDQSSQLLSATLARMGSVVFSYDMFAMGESASQFNTAEHRNSIAMTMQALNGTRIIDYLTSLKGIDVKRIAITGASGGGTQTMMLTALDKRIAVSVPVVMVSSWFYGGCPCESGLPVHSCGAWGTNNAEVAALAAPRPMLIVSDGGDWTANVPEIEFPYVQKVYGFYRKQDLIENKHFPKEGHDYGPSKRMAAYNFLAEKLGLNINAVKNSNGEVDESKATVEPKSAMLVFGEDGRNLPATAVRDIPTLRKVLDDAKR